MDQKCPQVGVASLRDPEKPRLAPCRGLSRHEPQPRGQIARPAEGLACPDRRYERSGVQGAEAGDCGSLRAA